MPFFEARAVFGKQRPQKNKMKTYENRSNQGKPIQGVPKTPIQSFPTPAPGSGPAPLPRRVPPSRRYLPAAGAWEGGHGGQME